MDALDLEMTFDFLYIYDGYNESAAQLVKTDRMPDNPFYQTSGNQVFLKMMKYSSNHRRRSQIRWGNSE